jgi:hypothetical protein
MRGTMVASDVQKVIQSLAGMGYFNEDRYYNKTVGIGKDFETLMDAFNWAKTLSFCRIKLLLDDGIHIIDSGLHVFESIDLIIESASQLKDNVKLNGSGNYFIRLVNSGMLNFNHLTITSPSSGPSGIGIEDGAHQLYFIDCTIKNLKLMSINFSGEISLNNCELDNATNDFSFFASDTRIYIRDTIINAQSLHFSSKNVNYYFYRTNTINATSLDSSIMINTHYIIGENTNFNISSNPVFNQIDENLNVIVDGASPVIYKTAFGPTNSRPQTPPNGVVYFDADLNQPIWYNGSDWVDALGNIK